MEMTIDTAITILGMVEAHGICIEAKDIAVETMRKYQKIAEIVTNNELEWGNASVRANAFLEVKKVVEDGKTN